MYLWTVIRHKKLKICDSALFHKLKLQIVLVGIIDDAKNASVAT